MKSWNVVLWFFTISHQWKADSSFKNGLHIRGIFLSTSDCAAIQVSGPVLILSPRSLACALLIVRRLGVCAAITMSSLKETSPCVSDSPDDSLSSCSGPVLHLIDAAEIAVQRSEDHFFNTDKSIDELFPNTTGNIRLHAIFKVYAVPDHETRTKLDFFDSNGNPSMVRAACNQRANSAVKENYKKEMLQKGLINGVRGYPLIIKCEGKPSA